MKRGQVPERLDREAVPTIEPRLPAPRLVTGPAKHDRVGYLERDSLLGAYRMRVATTAAMTCLIGKPSITTFGVGGWMAPGSGFTMMARRMRRAAAGRNGTGAAIHRESASRCHPAANTESVIDVFQ